MQNKTIYLTFDDGPLQPYLSEALAILEQFQAKATFFVCGINIERQPSLARQIVEAGHAIGNHSYSHSLIKTLSGNLLEEIERTGGLIKQSTGVDTKLYRSPWGITMPNLRRKLLAAGYKIYHWDIMALDWWQPSPQYIARRVIARIFPGAIVLLHLGDQTRKGDRENTVRALPIILKELNDQGYSFASLPGEFNG
jgi:peptidoglycan/xylan/chitin deacetylase (PgdA/CDA1 family)